MDPKIIYEDSEVIVVDKPSGWIVNEAKTTGKNPVLQTWLRKKHDYQVVNLSEYRSGIVHRLDKETSGILVVVKTGIAFSNLQEQFKQRKVEKTYIALVHGKVELKEDEINAPVGRLPWNRERFGVLPGGRSAETRYRVEKYYTNGDEKFSLLLLKPKTGRTHQIRIHLKHIGHPIVSDDFYAGRKTARSDRKWCPRLFLHAKKLKFTHPKTGKKIEVEADLPDDLISCLKKLKEL